MKYLLVLLILCPILGFTQDTLFNKTLNEVTVRSAGKKATEIAVVSTIIKSLSDP